MIVVAAKTSIMGFPKLFHQCRQALRVTPLVVLLMFLVMASTGCTNSFLNGWLDPSQVGAYGVQNTLEIRRSLSIQDTPAGVAGATEPGPDDLEPWSEEYRIAKGDVIVLRILELQMRGQETAMQVVVNETGMINMQLLGWFKVEGMTERELQDEIADLVEQRNLVIDPQVVVQVVSKTGTLYSVFGSIQWPGMYPVSRPDFRLLEALSQAGGLLDMVRQVYVYRIIKPGSSSSRVVEPAPPVGSQVDFSEGSGSVDYPTFSVLSQSFSPPRNLQAADTGTGSLGDDEEPPAEEGPSEDDFTQELMDILVPPTTAPEAEEPVTTEMATTSEAPTTAEAPTTSEAPATQAVLPQPAGRPSWVFLNGKWVELQPPPESPPITEPAPELDEAQVKQPAIEPEVDWGALAEEIEQRIIEIPADPLRDGEMRYNIVIRPGDVIRVKVGPTGEYYVFGQVFRPGAYSLTGREMTLKSAIASAGGLAPMAWPDRCTIVRRIGDREELIPVNLDAIFAGKEPDVYLKRDDLIEVGSHAFAPFLASIRTAFRFTYGFGFVYDRNFGSFDTQGGMPNPRLTREAERRALFPGIFP